MKRILLLLVIIFSCSSEDATNNEKSNTEDYKIFKIKQTFSDDGSVSTSEFNYKDGLLDFIKHTDKKGVNIRYYHYNSNKQITSITSDDGYENTFIYTGNNITKQLSSYSINGLDFETEYQYKYDNSGNNVESEKNYEDGQLTWHGIYEYDNKNNMVKLTELNVSNGNIMGTGTHTFDNKKNYYKTSYPKEYLIIGQANGENNILKFDTDENVYIYNVEGYPIMKSIYDNGVLESIVEIEYK